MLSELNKNTTTNSTDTNMNEEKKSNDSYSLTQFTDIKNKGNISNLDQNKDDLVYGYVRINYKNETKIVPVEVIRMIIFYSQDGIVWSFSKEEVAVFHTAKSGEKLCSHLLTIHDTKFNYTLKPSFRNPICIQFAFNFVGSMPKNMQYMEIYCELRCIESNNTAKGTQKFGTYQANDCLILNAVSMDKINEKYDKLTFEGILNVLSIKYTANDRLNNDPRFMNLTKMRKQTNFEWKIGKGYILKDFDPTKQIPKLLFSSNFNHDTFALFFSSSHAYSIQNPFKIGIKSLGLPSKIKKIDIKFCLMINKKKYKRVAIITNGWRMSFNLSDKYFIASKVIDINVKCTIKVIKAFDFDDKEIPDDQLYSYGIL